MPTFFISTAEGRIAVESKEPTADAVAAHARTQGYIAGDELVPATGRDTMGYKNPIAIPFHAIMAIRAKR